MKRLFHTLLALIVLSLSGNAQLLWEVSGNGLAKPSYIFGTHHVAPVSLLDSIPGLKPAIAAADKVFGELDMSQMMSPEVVQAMQMGAMAPADSTLSKLFTPAQLDSIGAIIQKYVGPVPVQQMDMLKPNMLATIIAMGMNQQIFPGFTGAEQLDTEVQNIARSLGKEVAGLETPAMQIETLFGAPLLMQASDLMEVVRDPQTVSDIAVKLAQLYLEGDLNGLFELMEKEPGANTEAALNRMIYDRNINWAKILAGVLPTAAVFVAVGAGHLPGDKGILNLLRKEGYTVSPAK